ncbi:MAG TPA: hydratase [Noviherbaspirillum sp.]|uniref:2-keto-4-pentenoate hydratase n=1 Tax=Noviherbaspirillum sp. TaxID=1926288 RepID=UPI002F92163A
MTPQALLEHLDHGRLWPHAPGEVGGPALPAAYQQALAVRRLRIARGERPAGFKIGFTNRTIWSRYQVFGPIWGTVWNTTLRTCEGQGVIDLATTCQPRIEPEVVFGMRTRPETDAGMDALFDAIDWTAPGFEVVQSHLPEWRFTAPDTVADSGLHASLLVGTKIPVRHVAGSAAALDRFLAAATVGLYEGGRLVEEGRGGNVLDSPLRALQHFLAELRACPGAPDLEAGDVVTTGTWTDAWPLRSGQEWQARFTPPLGMLSARIA